MATEKVLVPELGNFKDVAVIEVHVKPGDVVAVDAPLLTLETDKATMDVPAPFAGTIAAVQVGIGDKVSAGSHIVTMTVAAESGTRTTPAAAPAVAPTAAAAATAATGAAGQPAPAAAPVASASSQEVRVPDLGNFKDVTIIEVLVKPGDVVAAEAPLLTLETEKATMDVPAPFAGTVTAVHVAAGGKVSAGSLVATLSGVAAPAASATPGAAASAPVPAAPRPAAAAASAAVSGAGTAAALPAAGGLPPINEAGFATAHASPSVRQFARELGVNLAQVRGSGTKGRITAEDVKAFVKAFLSGALAPAAAPAPALPKVPVVDFAQFGAVEIKPLSRIQKISGARLHAAWVNLPHVTQFDQADVTDMEAQRKALKSRAEAEGVKLTPLAFILRACALVLKQFPRFNCSLDEKGENLVYKQYCHLGFAADTPNGLMVPVIRDADRKDVFALARALAELSDKARKGKLSGAEMQGGCFSISSLGGIGGTAFTPIINAPEVAILGVSKSSLQPVWQQDKFVPRLMLPLSLSYDHRVIDGAEGARFITALSNRTGGYQGAAGARGVSESDGEVELACPDIGNFKDVAVIDVLVKAGEQIELDTPLVTLETDKATMDVPATRAGTVTAVLVQVGSKVSMGMPLLRLRPSAGATGAAATKAPAAAAAASGAAMAPVAGATAPPPASAPAPARSAAPAIPDVPADRNVQLLVLGAGPGGYTAAFRAADLGLQVTLVERWPTLGGVCLNVGCIPSKALLHAAKVIDEAREMGAHGVSFGAPSVDLDKLRAWKGKVVGRLTGGLTALAKQRKVEVVRGSARFLSPHVIEVTHEGRSEKLHFEQCIVAAGSEPIALPFLPQDPRIMDSTGALELPPTDGRLLVIGGGIIGLEMACVYEALGAKLSVVELTSQLMPGADPDLVRPLEKRLKGRYEQILLNTKVSAARAEADGIHVTFEDAKGSNTQVFQRVLSAVGRVPNGRRLNAEAAGLTVSERGFIPVDRQLRTNVPHIFAIGDIVGQPMLAHKASHEGKVAAEVAAGQKSYFDARVIPSVAYTDPEVAWVGLTETAAKAQGLTVEKGVFPWAASGRSLSLGRDEGFTKLIIDPATHRVVGGAMVGPNAGELVAEVALAIEMGADAADIGLTVHPHPTLSESVGMAAEAWEGTLTDLYLPRKKS